jgi:hypothetical protein
MKAINNGEIGGGGCRRRKYGEAVSNGEANAAKAASMRQYQRRAGIEAGIISGSCGGGS